MPSPSDPSALSDSGRERQSCRDLSHDDTLGVAGVHERVVLTKE
jgi:hypothetical protein